MGDCAAFTAVLSAVLEGLPSPVIDHGNDDAEERRTHVASAE